MGKKYFGEDTIVDRYCIMQVDNVPLKWFVCRATFDECGPRAIALVEDDNLKKEGYDSKKEAKIALLLHTI